MTGPATGPEPGGLRTLLLLLKKDLLLQWRERAQGVAILAFGGASLLLFSFAVAAVVDGARFSLAGAVVTFLLIVVGEIAWGLAVASTALALRHWARETRVEMVIALLEGERATLKKLFREGGGKIRLQPANQRLKPIFVDQDDVRVQGVVIGVLRKY